MPTVGVRELKEQGSRILRQVREEGVEFDVTYHGRVIAHLIPARQSERETEDLDAVWTGVDRLAAEVGARWPSDTTAADAVRDDRRDI